MVKWCIVEIKLGNKIDNKGVLWYSYMNIYFWTTSVETSHFPKFFVIRIYLVRCLKYCCIASLTPSESASWAQMISTTLGYLLLPFHVVFELTRDKKIKLKNYYIIGLTVSWRNGLIVRFKIQRLWWLHCYKVFCFLSYPSTQDIDQPFLTYVCSTFQLLWQINIRTCS